MNTYSWNALDYEKNSSAQLAWARELIPKLNLQGNERVLDIGCGDGKVSAEIALHVPSTYGRKFAYHYEQGTLLLSSWFCIRDSMEVNASCQL